MESCENLFSALSFSPQKFISSKTRDFSRKRFVASQRQLQENVFTRANLFGGGNLIVPPHLTPQIQCLPEGAFQRNKKIVGPVRLTHLLETDNTRNDISIPITSLENLHYWYCTSYFGAIPVKYVCGYGDPAFAAHVLVTYLLKTTLPVWVALPVL